MFLLTDEAIEGAIDNVSGFIIAKTSAETGRTLQETAERFYASQMYALLSDKETGYYWDSIPEMIERFKAELEIETRLGDEHT
jgi:hypothetical protein